MALVFGSDEDGTAPTTGRVPFAGCMSPDDPIRRDRGDGDVVKPNIHIARVHGDPGRQGGEHRVLVDRLWPRGQSRDAVDQDEWVTDITPSTELRRWYGHDPERFTEFARRYRAELAMPPAAEIVSRLREVSRVRRIVLLTATRDVEHSGATVLRDVIVGTHRK